MPKYDIVCEDTGVVLGFRETDEPLTPEQEAALKKGYLSEKAAEARAVQAQKAETERLKLKDKVLTEALNVIKNSPDAPDLKLLEQISKEIQADVQEVIAATPVKVDPVVDPIDPGGVTPI